jgi:hypothetical protein
MNLRVSANLLLDASLSHRRERRLQARKYLTTRWMGHCENRQNPPSKDAQEMAKP